MDFFKFFLKLKRKNHKLFSIIGILNELLVSIAFTASGKKPFFFRKKIKKNNEFFELRQLTVHDSVLLKNFLGKIPGNEIVFFKPHSFDLKTIKLLLGKKSFLAMAVFFKKQIAGYGLIKFFFPKKAMIGVFIEKNFRNTGLGKILTNELSVVAEKSDFIPHATISKKNHSSVKMVESCNFIPVKNLGDELLFQKPLVNRL